MGKKKATRKAPTKECPKCGKKVHVRKSACTCGHQFTAKKAAPTPKKKKAARSKPQATNLTDALKAERATLQQRIDKIDELLDTYQ